MDTIHKYLVVPLMLAGLSIAFILICLVVAVTRGRAAWVRRKLKIGALIFALQAAAGVSVEASGTCYEPRAAPVVQVHGVDGGSRVLVGYESAGRLQIVVLPAGAPPEVRLSLRDAEPDAFSFRFLQGDRVVASGPVTALEGQGDAAVIQLSSQPLAAGVYLLKLYYGSAPGREPSERDLYQAYGVQVQ